MSAKESLRSAVCICFLQCSMTDKEVKCDMGVMDEFKAERNAVRQGTPGEKLQYFLDYYKGYVVLGAVVLCIIISVVVGKLNEKEVLLTGILLNNQMTSEEAVTRLKESFLGNVQRDPEETELTLMTKWRYDADTKEYSEDNYYALQTLSAQTAGGVLDFMTGDLDTMTVLAYGDYFEDISLILTEEQMKCYEPYLLYMDMAVLEAAKAAVDAEAYDTQLTIPDCTKPEEMEKPVPIFIDLSWCEALSDIYPEAAEPVVLAVAVNAPHTDMIGLWLEFLMDT